MNILGFIFCILTVLSLGAMVAFEKQVSAFRLRVSYLGHIVANRDIFNQSVSEFYDCLKSHSPPGEKEEKEKKPKSESSESHLPPAPLINPHCARLNLSPLIAVNGMYSNSEKSLYEITAKLLKTFYGEALFESKARAEYDFLDSFLKEARNQTTENFFLEKVVFKDSDYQEIYYKMLKGMKQNNILEEIGYPSLLDYIKIDLSKTKICLFHAHPNLLSVFFTSKAATKLYAALHTPKTPAITQETIERICQEVHAPILNLDLFDFIELHSKQHPPHSKGIMVGKDPESHISLRKVVSL